MEDFIFSSQTRNKMRFCVRKGCSFNTQVPKDILKIVNIIYD